MTRITTRTRIATLATLARSAADSLRAAAPKARTRTLDADDIRIALGQHRAAMRQAAADDVVITTTLRGGFVPNGYTYPADADEVRIRTDLATGETSISPLRANAQRRRHGNGDLCITRLVRADQTDGRIVRF
mgnify:CR=1 FL=1